MFASRLLDILQTVPSDVEYETCVFDLSEKDMAMKESKKDNNPLPLEVKSEDESWEATLVNELENENRAKDSPINEDQNGILLNLCPNTPASDSFTTDTNPFTDKNVLECELPELVVCYKEIDYHAVKDICVDEGMPVKDNIVIGHYEDDVRKNDDDEKLLAHEKTKSPPDGSLDKDEGSLVDEKLPIQEFGTRSFLRSFIGSLDDDENNLNQIPSDKEDSNGPDSHPQSLFHNSKIENGSIISNLNSPENTKEQPVDSGNVHEQPLIIEDGKSDDSSADSQVQSGNSKNKNEELVHEQQSVSSYTNNNDEQAFEGESSFAVGRVSYSGPIAFSGSISHRSEGSAASGRSFAFPVLQNEWNSSPVRMRKAERRLKHKGWRSGIFCCRF